MTKLILLVILFSSAAFADAWRVEVLKQGDRDLVRVFSTADNSRKPLFTLKSEAIDQGYKSSEEIYLKSTKRHYLVIRWYLGDDETLKIYDPHYQGAKEIYKLQTMPSEFIVKYNKVVFQFPFAETLLQTEWVPKVHKN